jgi:hypothetical protein
MRLPGQPEKSAVADHTFQIGHSIGFSSIFILHKVTGYMEILLKEAFEIRLHSRNFNRDALSIQWVVVSSD